MGYCQGKQHASEVGVGDCGLGGRGGLAVQWFLESVGSCPHPYDLDLKLLCVCFV